MRLDGRVRTAHRLTAERAEFRVIPDLVSAFRTEQGVISFFVYFWIGDGNGEWLWGNAPAFGRCNRWCRPPDLSFRGAKRRGNLLQQPSNSPRLSCHPTEYCEIATAPSGPRNDKSENRCGRRGNLGKALPFGTSHRQNGNRPRLVIARRRSRRGNLGKALPVRTRYR